MLIPIAACIGIAALSLLLPSEPSYDPWAWLVWAREIAHLELDTSAGPSWKPLPVALLALATPLGDDLSLALWIVVARAGALLAMVLAFRLAARLTGGPPALRAVAGTTAAVALALTPDWLQFTAHASEAPLAVALLSAARLSGVALGICNRHVPDFPARRRPGGAPRIRGARGRTPHGPATRSRACGDGGRRAEALRALGSTTANRALHTRLAWELGCSIKEVQRGYGHNVVVQTSDEKIAGAVLVWGRPEERRLLARAGSFEVYRRIGVSYRLVNGSFAGLSHLARSYRIRPYRVVTR